jgi:hypothetical protein
MRPRLTFAALLALATLPAVASAQGQLRPGISPNTQPTTSPYLNLLRPGTAPGINYYGIVRPEFAFRSSIQGLQGDVDANRQLIATGRDAQGQPLLVTGHSATFLNTGGYFLSLSGGKGSAPVTGSGGRPGGQGIGTGGGGTAPKRGK